MLGSKYSMHMVRLACLACTISVHNDIIVFDISKSGGGAWW
jgi:hypothetical protein